MSKQLDRIAQISDSMEANGGTRHSAEHYVNLAKQIHDEAEQAGHRHIYALAALLHKRGEQPVVILAEVTNDLANGPDDTWSGRSGDVRRAYYDGMRQAAKRIARAILMDTDLTAGSEA